MSDHLTKLKEFQRAWIDAEKSYVSDIMAAKGDMILIQAIDINWWRHQANWSMAATAALERTSPAIVSILNDAKDANDRIERERKGAANLAKIIRASSAAAKSLAKLLEAVAGALEDVQAA